jgi:hypothetical protein
LGVLGQAVHQAVSKKRPKAPKLDMIEHMIAAKARALFLVAAILAAASQLSQIQGLSGSLEQTPG